MTGTCGEKLNENEEIDENLGTENVPTYVFMCTQKLGKPVRGSIKSQDRTQGAVPRLVEEDSIRCKRARLDAPTPRQMYFRYINEIRPVGEDLIEIDVSENFAPIKFEPNRESIYHDFVS